MRNGLPGGMRTHPTHGTSEHGVDGKIFVRGLTLAAVILALFFGGGRALIRVMQGKPAATEPEFLHIDLREGPGEGGRFKPLH